MMKLAFAATLLASSVASAGDSTWLLCRSGSEHLVASVHEHRKGADAREVSITLVFGDHVAKGVIGAKDATTLRDLEGKHTAVFTGTAKLALDTHRLAFAGTLDWSGGATKAQKLAAELACDVVAD